MKRIFLNIFIISLVFALPTKKMFDVEGMMCGYGCVSTINSIVTSLGVENCTVDFDNSMMEVVFDDENLSVEQVIAALPNPYIATYIGESIDKAYLVQGMTCMGCVKSINDVLSKLKGIYAFNIDLENKMLDIEFDPNTFNDDILFSTIPDKFKVIPFISTKKNNKNKIN